MRKIQCHQYFFRGCRQSVAVLVMMGIVMFVLDTTSTSSLVNNKYYSGVEAFRGSTTTITSSSFQRLRQKTRHDAERIGRLSSSWRKSADEYNDDGDENTNNNQSYYNVNNNNKAAQSHPLYQTLAAKTTAPMSQKMIGGMVGLSFGWLLFFIGFPLPAWAGFGPSGGATTSPTPGLSKINVQVQDLSKRKLEQVIGSTIDVTRLSELQAQIDALIEGIMNSYNNNDDTDTTDETVAATDDNEADGSISNKARRIIEENLFSKPTEEQKLELEKAKLYQAQILRRERLLDALEAQPWWFNYFAAFCGSVISTLVMHPVDTIKTRLQVKPFEAVGDNDNEKKKNDDKVSTTNSKENPAFFANLYEGLGGNILKEGPPSALYLGVYESVKASLLHGKMATTWASLMGLSSSGAAAAVLGSSTGGSPVYLLSIYLMSGAAGELIGSTIRAPAETVKTMVQTQTAETLSQAFDLALKRPEGRQNVLRAWSSSALRDIPFGAIQLALFELIKAYILNNPDIDFDSSTLQSEAIIGAVAASIGSFVTNPLDVVATRIISQPITTSADDNMQEPLGVVGMAKTIYREGGLFAFFSGWQARVLYWGPAISIFLTCYCSIRQLEIQFDLFNN